MALHLTRLEGNRKTMNKGEAEGQLLEQIVCLLPSLRLERKSGGREEKEDRDRETKPNPFTHRAFQVSSGIVDAYLPPPKKKKKCKWSVICFTPLLWAGVDNSLLADCLAFLTVQYFSIWLQLSKTNLMLSSISE